jgi:transposase-like protein
MMAALSTRSRTEALVHQPQVKDEPVGGDEGIGPRPGHEFASAFEVQKMASELGTNANLLGRWCRDFRANGGAAFSGQSKPVGEVVSLDRYDNRPWKKG